MTQELFLGLSGLLLVKIGVVILLALYLIFALIVVRQTKLMTDTVQMGKEGFIRLLGYVHMGFAVFVFLTALIIL